MSEPQVCRSWTKRWFGFGLLLETTVILLAWSAPPVAQADETAKSRSANLAARPIELVGIRNAFRVTPSVYSGSQPDGEDAFDRLVLLGVKTIVSVDGGKPDVAAARRHGIRYVHLPIGYDGIPTNRVIELVLVAAATNGPVFVHCHHGLHRGPAAVAIICQASAGWSADQAESWLKQAGTSLDYPGLYRAAREFKPPSADQLAAVKELPEVAPTSSVVEMMVAIDEHFDRLKHAQKGGWKSLPGERVILPAHEATLLWEQFRELARTPDTQQRPQDYRRKLADSEAAAARLQSVLAANTGIDPADAALKQVTQSCAACHKAYRNN